MAQSTAEHVLFLLLALAKHGNLYLDEMKAGVWRRRVGTELAGKVIGVLGYGHIGKITARMAHSLGMEVIASRNSPEKGNEGNEAHGQGRAE